jgi:hypothetical protein
MAETRITSIAKHGIAESLSSADPYKHTPRFSGRFDPAVNQRHLHDFSMKNLA